MAQPLCFGAKHFNNKFCHVTYFADHYLHCSSLHGSLSSSRLSLAEIGAENEGESKEDAEGMCVA